MGAAVRMHCGALAHGLAERAPRLVHIAAMHDTYSRSHACVNELQPRFRLRSMSQVPLRGRTELP